jgi:hypothetical protein
MSDVKTMRLHAGFQKFKNEREKGEEHWSLFDDESACVAHVFVPGLAERLAVADARLAAAEAEALALRSALLGVRHARTTELCWCSEHWAVVMGRGHSDGCEAARVEVGRLRNNEALRAFGLRCIAAVSSHAARAGRGDAEVVEAVLAGKT